LKVLDTILSAQDVDLCTLHQFGFITPLLIFMLDADKDSTPTPTSPRHTLVCHETLTQLYTMLSSYPVLDDIRTSLVTPQRSCDFTYHQLLDAIKNSNAHVGNAQSQPTMTTFLQGPLKDKLLSFISQSCTSNKEGNMQLCTQHPQMLQMIPLALKLFNSFFDRPELSQKLAAKQFIEILKYTDVNAADLVKTELWLQTIAALNLEVEHPLVDSESILEYMSGHTQDNLYNQLAINQGDNQQCLRLLKLTLSKEIGVGGKAFKSALIEGRSKGLLLAYVRDKCTCFNLSDKFMSENHFLVWKGLDWYTHKPDSSFMMVQKHYEGLQETFWVQAKTDQEQLERQERLKLSAEKAKPFRCYIEGCHSKIPKDSHFCVSCLESGKIICCVCNQPLLTEIEFSSRMCMYDMNQASIHDAVIKKCPICNSEFQSELDLCKACLEAFESA